MTEETAKLKNLLEQSRRIVFFGGAGVSTESQIPDFRSDGGLYRDPRARQYKHPPEVMLSHSFFISHPQEFFEFYFDRMIYPNAKPNPAHIALATLERQGKLTAVVTQNIDGLHQMAGSRNVLELHGSVLRNTCMECRAHYDLDYMLAHEDEGIPRCSQCGGVVKPDVVLYEECLDQDTMEQALSHISQADLLIVGGTSLAVYPAAGLIRYFSGGHLVLINKSATGYDNDADLIIRESIGTVLGECVDIGNS